MIGGLESGCETGREMRVRNLRFGLFFLYKIANIAILKNSKLKRRRLVMEREPEGFLTFLAAPPHNAEVFFLPVVLTGKSWQAPYLRTVADIAEQAGSDNIKPQFKRMFWRLLKLKIDGRQAIEQILVFDNSLHIWLDDGIRWADIRDNVVLILHQGLYPGKKISVNGLTSRIKP